MCMYNSRKIVSFTSVTDPDPDPENPYVFGPPGSGSVGQSYGSESFYQQAKKDPRIRIRTKMSWIRNISFRKRECTFFQ